MYICELWQTLLQKKQNSNSKVYFKCLHTIIIQVKRTQQLDAARLCSRNEQMNVQMKRHWMIALRSNKLMISSEGKKKHLNLVQVDDGRFSVIQCTIPPTGAGSWILGNWPRLYRRKPQNWQNTCSYMRYPCRRRAKWSRTNFSEQTLHCVCVFFVVLAFFPLLLSFGFCCCFSILGKPQKPKPACNNRIVYNFTCVFIRDNNLPYLTIVERFRSDNGGSGDADRHRPRLCSLCKICSFMVRNKTKWMHVNDNLLAELVLVVGFER